MLHNGKDKNIITHLCYSTLQQAFFQQIYSIGHTHTLAPKWGFGISILYHHPIVDRMEMLYLDKIQSSGIYWCPLKPNTSLFYQDRLNTFFFLCFYIKYIKRCNQDDDAR